VTSSWPNFVSQCKSRLSAIARSCFLGRAHWHQKFEEVKELLEELRKQCAQFEAQGEQLEQENRQLRERVAELTSQLAQPQPVKLPLGDVPGGQQYGAGMMTLCVNLAGKIGLRLAERSLHVVFDWLGVEVKIPRYQTIRLWMQRIGLDRMENAKKAGGGAWLTDHTNQIGREKVLVVLRVPDDQLPRRGIPLRHQDVEVLAVVPGEEWKRDDVRKVYQETAARYGMPRVIETDGAVELREPAETLGKRREKPLVIRDLKHFLANRFEALLTQDPQYQAFTKQVGGTRPALQQTELAHFIPPGFKIKARFMNLARTLDWASTVLWHLDHPDSQSREGIQESRMREKLGWLRDFASSILQWQVCQQVVSTALTFINKQGIFQGATKQFKRLVVRLAHNAMSRRLVGAIVKFLRGYEQQLRPNERLPMSTEILESSFSLYKQLEKQHSKSGFTSLLLTYPTLLRKTTPEEVTASFKRTKVADVKEWITKHLPTTVASKRQLVFREARTKTKTPNRATPVNAAA
jgi:hypothetical protein